MGGGCDDGDIPMHIHCRMLHGSRHSMFTPPRSSSRAPGMSAEHRNPHPVLCRLGVHRRHCQCWRRPSRQPRPQRLQPWKLQPRGRLRGARAAAALADIDLMPRGIVHRPDCRRLVGVCERTHARTHTHTIKQRGIISWKPGCACTARRSLRRASDGLSRLHTRPSAHPPVTAALL